MRNWHHIVIKLKQARLISGFNDNQGNSDIYIGVIEGQTEFEKIGNVNFPLTINNYKASHPSFSDILGTKKVFFRGVKNGKFSQEIQEKFLPSMHTTCVTGIISGNTDNINKIDGITPNIRVINAKEFKDSLFLSLIQSYSNNNINSEFYKWLKGTDYINNGPFDISDIHSNHHVSVINCSFKIKSNSNNMREKVDLVLSELFAYGRNGRGTLVVFSAGNDSLNISDNPSSLGFRADAYSKKTLIVAASKVELDGYPLPSYSVPNPIFKEKKSTFSNYGNRVDLCAPSGPDANPSTDDINIYSPTMINCGDVGTDDQVSLVTISSQPSSNKLILSNIKGVFKGQSIELGEKDTYTHEIRYITNVEEIPNTNDVKITLNQDIKYTKNNADTGNFNLVNTTARLLVFRKVASRYIDSQGNISNNRLNLDSLKGIKASVQNHQKVYIYDVNSPLNGIYTEIVDVLNPLNKTIELKNSLQQFSTNSSLVLIPDQITATLKCITDTVYSSVNSSVLSGFFIGQEVLLSSGGSDKRIAFIEEINPTQILFTHFPGVVGTEYTITSLAYGNFTSRFTGTSAAAPIVSGLAGLVLSANQSLNSAEIKHILKYTTDQIGNVGYSLVTNPSNYNYGYEIDSYFGAGRVNAEKAIKLALNWHKPDNQQSLPFPEIPVEKPILAIADKLSGGYSGNLENVPSTDPVDSPDIWFNVLGTSPTLPSLTNPLNRIDTSKDQKLFIKVRNSGNRNTFQECDIRVYVAFTDEVNPAFPFPTKWYDQTDVKLLSVVELPIINPSSEIVVPIEWKNIAAFWNTYNKQDSVTGLRKRAYILVHVSPFDGLDNAVMTDNLRNNKQLTCKEIIVTHNGVSDRTAYLPGNKLDITVGTELVSKSFDLAMENVLVSELDTIKIKAIKKDRQTQATDEIVFKKIGNSWAIESGSGDWIEFQTPTELATNYNGYKNIVFPHTINVNQEEQEVKLTIENA